MENGQVAVYRAPASGNRYTLVDTALFLPEGWTSDAAWCGKACIPKPFRKFRTKPELALEMAARQKSAGVKSDFVDADGFYGNAPRFPADPDGSGRPFDAEAQGNEWVYVGQPSTAVPEAKGHKPSTTRWSKWEADTHNDRQA